MSEHAASLRPRSVWSDSDEIRVIKHPQLHGIFVIIVMLIRDGLAGLGAIILEQYLLEGDCTLAYRVKQIPAIRERIITSSFKV